MSATDVHHPLAQTVALSIDHLARRKVFGSTSRNCIDLVHALVLIKSGSSQYRLQESKGKRKDEPLRTCNLNNRPMIHCRQSLELELEMKECPRQKVDRQVDWQEHCTSVSTRLIEDEALTWQ